MIRRLVFRIQARSDIADAIAWYQDHGDGIDTAFLRALDAALGAIQRNPYQFQKFRGQMRRALLRRFPYGVIYRPSDDEIVIVACAHGRRNPDDLEGRD
jgi:plasmid stabilization system protein ParE